MNKIKFLSTKNKSLSKPPSINIEDFKLPEIQGYTKQYAPTVEQSNSEKQETPDYTTGYIYNPPKQEKPKVKSPLLPGKGKIYKNREEFVKDLTEAYEKELLSKGLNPNYAKMLVAQDAHESAWGSSSLSEVYNFGGIKATGNSPRIQKDTTEFVNNNVQNTKADFRKFDSLDDYAAYKVNLLNSSRYNAFTGDPSQFYQRVKAGGYATDPDYVSKLLKMYNSPIFSKKLGGKLPNIK